MDFPNIRPREMRRYYFSLIVAMIGVSTYLGLSQSIVTFERGIEIVRSRGYSIDRDMEWDLAYMGDWDVSERGLRSFLDACKIIQREQGSLTVHVDFYAKVLFVFDSSRAQTGRTIYFCNLA